MRHCTIQIGRNTVTKTAAPDLMRIEVEKTRRAFEIGKDCGLFRVPEVVEYDEARGVVVFERLNIEPAFHVVRWGNDYNMLGELLGRALAIIHDRLILPEDMKIPLPSSVALAGDFVFLHGDLGSFNICVDRNWKITIIDWQTTALLGGKATYGTRYFDLIWFIDNMIYRPTIRQIRFFLSDNVTPVVKRFMSAYLQESNAPYDPEQFVLYIQKFRDVLWPLVERSTTLRHRLLLFRSNALKRYTMECIAQIPSSNLALQQEELKPT